MKIRADRATGLETEEFRGTPRQLTCEAYPRAMLSARYPTDTAK
jgi:hypothetical protein